MTQQTFHGSMSIVDVPRSSRADPLTSHKAADRVKDSGALAKQQRLVLKAVKRWPGRTSAELAEKMAACDRKHWPELRAAVARRLPELALRHVKRGKERKCAVSRQVCITWWPR